MDTHSGSNSFIGTRRLIDEVSSSSSRASSPDSQGSTNSPVLARKNNHDSSRVINDDNTEKRERRKTLDFKKRRRTTIVPGQPRNSLLALEANNPLPVFTSLSIEEINKRYEEWMKIAADNKINASNTWNFELIEYFSKLSLFRDGDSINFQKASCTLDGCVKIYTSRVDSVVSETGILLNGLAESSAQKTKELEEEFTGESAKPKKKASRTEQTLAKDYTSITLKAFDLEFSVDPLFKKTSADFDEGGARGLLLNNLSTYDNGRLIFDASDATVSAIEQENEIELEEHEVPRVQLSLSGLMSSLFNDDALNGSNICPSLKNFQFGSTNTLEIPENRAEDIHDGPDPDAFNEHDDFFDPVDNNDQTIGGYALENDMLEAGDANNSENEEKFKTEGVVTQSVGILADTENMFSYFDDRFVKNWSGPEHWKLQRVRNNKRVEAKRTETATTEPKRKAEKSQFELDFSGIDGEFDTDAVLASGSGSINAPKTNVKAPDTFLLPDDLHFSSKNLLKLFTKPTFSLKPKVLVKKVDGVEKIETSFKVESDQVAQFDKLDMGEETSDTPAYAEECFNGVDDAYGDTPYDPISFTPNAMLEYGTSEKDDVNIGDQLITSLNRIQSIKINYMKQAKRVDVKLLKNNLWSAMDPQRASNCSCACGSNEPTSQPNPVEKCEDGAHKFKFSKLVHGLSGVYPKSKLNDLSVPFCFICLLHLANEHNLEIHNNPTMDELSITKEEAMEE